jgi:hypothetical protein
LDEQERLKLDFPTEHDILNKKELLVMEQTTSSCCKLLALKENHLQAEHSAQNSRISSNSMPELVIIYLYSGRL